MTRFVYTDALPSVLLRTEEAEPECGKDFCDHCGDCLACFGGDWCPNEGRDNEHWWVVYETPAAEPGGA
jgi:hypothetical protein